MLFLFIVFFVVMPYLVQGIAKQAILDYTKPYGIQQVTIDNVNLNLFKGTLSLNKLNLYKEKQPVNKQQENGIIHIGELSTDIEWLALFQSRLLIHSLYFADTNLPFSLNDQQQLFLAGIPLTSSTPKEPKEPNEESQMMVLPGLDKIAFRNIQLSLERQEKITTFTIEDLSLKHLYAWKDEYGRFELKAYINQSLVQANLQLHLFAKQPKIVGTFQTNNLNASEFKQFLPKLDFALDGILNANTTFTLTQTDKGPSLYQQGTISLSELLFTHPKNQSSVQSINWQGDLTYHAEEAQKIDLNGQLSVQNIVAKQAQQTLNMAQLTLNGKTQLSVAKTIDIQANDTIQISGLRFSDASNKQSLSSDLSAKINAKITVDNNKIDLKQKGSITLKNLKGSQDTLLAQLDKLNWQGNLVVAKNNHKINIKVDDNIQITGFNLNDKTNQLSLSSDISAKINANATLDGTQVNLRQKGSLTLQNLKGSQDALIAQLDTFNWQGDFTLSQNEALVIGSTGKVELNKITLNNGQQNTTIAHANQFKIGQVKVNSIDSINLDDISVNGLSIASHNKQPGLVTLQNLSVNQLNYLKNGQERFVDMGNIMINGSETHLSMDKDGQITQLTHLLNALPKAKDVTASQKSTLEPTQKPIQGSTLEAAQHIDADAPKTKASSTTQTAENSPQKEPFHYQLASLKMAGDNSIYLVTQQVKPAISKTIKINQLFIGKIASKTPLDLTDYNLKVNLDEFSSLTSKGALTPLDPTKSLNAKTTLDSLSLVEFSPLVEEKLGYHISSGQLSAQLETKIQNSQIDASNKLHLHKFELETVNTEKTSAIEKGFPVPLKTGLGMLQDKNDNIDLSLPVKGDLTKPDFNINDVIAKALGGAIAGASRTYLLLALQPFGAIALAGEYALNKASAITLQPIDFETGLSTLNPKMQTYLNKITTLLKERKAIEIKVCGGVIEADRMALKQVLLTSAIQKQAKANQEKQNGNGSSQNHITVPDMTITDKQMLELASERQKVIKRYLMSQGIPSKQVILCKPEILKNEKNANKAQIQLTI